MLEQEKGKREQILEAAIVVFSEKGFQASKIEEIAQKADVGKGTIYEYFDSKKDLFKEMVIFTVEHYKIKILKELETAKNSREKLEFIIRGHIEYCYNYRQMARVFIQDHSWGGQEFTQWLLTVWAEKTDAVKKILLEGIESGEFREMDAELVATSLLGMMDGVCNPIIFTEREVDSDNLVEKIMEIVLTGIKKY